MNKFWSWTLSVLVMSSTSAFADKNHDFHLDLETSFQEFRELLKTDLKKNAKIHIDNSDIEFAIGMGERLFKWLEAINEKRPAGQELRITSPETRRRYPIEKPAVLNPKKVARVTAKNLRTLPEDIKHVLLNNVPFPTTLSVDDKTFAKLVLPVEQNYRDAARWRSLIKWKDDYVLGSRRDVRGYYYLKTNNIKQDDLKDVRTIEASKLKLITDALVKVCRNDYSETRATCENKVKTAVDSNTLSDHYSKYYPFGEKMWNRFMRIPDDEVRKDIVMENNILYAPFQTPSIEKFIPFLRDNIEDEFKWGPFELKMVFGNDPTSPFLEFVPGEVPHVPEGNNKIVMDANASIEEWDTQWVVRHEYGHILGLPDCQHEFYDENLDAFVAYQLDVEDLMCSRGGKMNERIYKELKRVYGR